jgi:hypothetical protein
MVTGFNPTVPIIAGLLDSIIEELGAKARREHGTSLLRDDETLNALKNRKFTKKLCHLHDDYVYSRY